MIQITGDREASDLLKIVAKQAKYFTSVALNEAANAGQAAGKAAVSKPFTLRRADFIRNTIVRVPGQDFATKSKLSGAVRIDDRVDSKGRKRDYLAKFVAGGQKRPISGNSLAVPVNAPRNASGIITNANRPAALKGKKGYERITTDRGKDLLVRFTGRGRGQRVIVLYSLKKSVPIRAVFPFHDVIERAAVAAWPDAVANSVVNALLTRKD